MAKMSIIDVLRRRQRFRAVSFLACLALLLILGQLILVNGGTTTKAAADWFRDPVAKSCKLLATRSPGVQYNIPANCEGYDILIDGAITVYTDDVLLWQGSTNNHYECPPTYPGDSSYIYNSLSGSTCKYLKYVSVTDTQTMISPYYYCPYSWWFLVGGQYVAYNNLVSQTPIEDAYKRTKYQCTYSNTISSPSWKTYTAKSVKDVKGQDCTVPQNSGYKIDAGQFTECDSKRRFNSLQLLDGANLTHNPLDPAEMGEDTNSNGSLADEIIGSGRFKKVDLVVDGQVKLASNSSINVDKAGYPASSHTATKGYGIGGGGTVLGDGCARGDSECMGGGAGYAGVGFAGSGYGSVGGAIVNNNPNIATDSDFEWGSAGGYARQFAPGGAGGGRIRLLVTGTLDMSDDSSISANGENGRNTGDPHDSWGGAGAGGTIKIVMSRYIGGNSPRVSAAELGYTINNGSLELKKDKLKGTVTLVNFSSNDSTGPIVSTDGGFSTDGTASMWHGGGNPNFLGSGSGGRIYIKAASSGGVTVRKILTSVSRNGIVAAGANDFNPYALQIGDIINVTLYLSSSAGTLSSVKDDFLTSAGTATCKYVNGTAIPAGTADTTGMLWVNIPQTTSQLSYQCKVQKN